MMSNIVVILLCSTFLSLIPVLIVALTEWLKEAGRLLHYAIKTHSPEDIVNASMYCAISCGLMAAIAAVIDKYVL